MHLFSIVEGRTEVAALPGLLSRVWSEIVDPQFRIHLIPHTPSCFPRDSLLAATSEVLSSKLDEAALELSKRIRSNATDRGIILIILDADEDCPAKLAPELLGRSRSLRTDVEMDCVIVNRQFENWFKACAPSLNVPWLPSNLAAEQKPEEGNGSRWLDSLVRSKSRKNKYKKTKHALELVRVMDLQMCRENSPSFDKLCRVLETRYEAMIAPNPIAPVEESPP